MCVRHVCKGCEQTISCWLEEAERRERKQMQKELACRNEMKKVEENVCEKTAPPEQNATNKKCVCVFQHAPEIGSAPPAYKHHYPVAELTALKLDHDLDCSPFQRPAQNAARVAIQAAARAEAEARGARAAADAAVHMSQAQEFPRVPILPVQQAAEKSSALAATDSEEEREEDEEQEVFGDASEMVPSTTDSERPSTSRPRVTRSKTIKSGKISVTAPKDTAPNITAPMVEVAGPDGPMLVFRAWTMSDMRDAMAHLPDPQDAGEKFAKELFLLCQEFSPTSQELRR
ncbi:uncharacterized protein LOC107681588, partial [Sinocyclocheilus anshuiensis]|uniref:uncharacterized protein LOC107681588 n=1 Tax=Sinocyclocheilus anshuiensis TaxID=1608454 RepID=UPI0007BA955A